MAAHQFAATLKDARAVHPSHACVPILQTGPTGPPAAVSQGACGARGAAPRPPAPPGWQHRASPPGRAFRGASRLQGSTGSP